MDMKEAIQLMDDGILCRLISIDRVYRIESGVLEYEQNPNFWVPSRNILKLARGSKWEVLEEKTLSDHFMKSGCFGCNVEVCSVKRVQEFINDIKEKFCKRISYNHVIVKELSEIIDKSAGDKFK